MGFPAPTMLGPEEPCYSPRLSSGATSSNMITLSNFIALRRMAIGRSCLN